MKINDIKELLAKYHWILESESPLNIKSEDGEHHAQNFAAEVVIEYFILLDESDNDDDKEDLIERFKLIEQVNKDESNS